MSTITILIMATSIISLAAQMTFTNNCTTNITIYTNVPIGINPYPNGQVFEPNTSQSVAVGDTWLASVYAEKLQTAAVFSLDAQIDNTYWGSVIDGFNYPLEIQTNNQSCSTIQCLGKPSKDCMDNIRQQNKRLICGPNTQFTVTFCPEKTSLLEDIAVEKGLANFLSNGI